MCKVFGLVNIQAKVSLRKWGRLQGCESFGLHPFAGTEASKRRRRSSCLAKSLFKPHWDARTDGFGVILQLPSTDCRAVSGAELWEGHEKRALRQALCFRNGECEAGIQDAQSCGCTGFLKRDPCQMGVSKN